MNATPHRFRGTDLHPFRFTVRHFISCLAFVVMTATYTVSGQSRTTQKLQEEYGGSSRAFFFYNNTLRMINQAEDPEFDEAIRDIEKMKLLLIGKEDGFDFKSIVGRYKDEDFQEIMTSRHKGRNFDIFLKEKDGKTSAMLALVNDDENLFVLDIVGSIDPNKMVKFFSVMDETSDISGKIKNFVKQDDKSEREDTTNEEGSRPEE